MLRGIRWPARWKIALGIVAVVALAVGFGFGPYARHRAQAEAERRGLELRVDGVSPGWFAVELHGVHLAPEGVEGLEVSLDVVQVDLSVGMHVRSVTVHGGAVELTGPPDEVVDRLAAWRDRHRAEGTSSGSPGPTLEVDGIRASWTKLEGGSDATASADGLAVHRDGEGTQITIGGADVTFPDKTLHVAEATASWDAERHLHDAHAKILELRFVLPPAPAAPVAPPDEPPPPPPVAKGKPVPFVFTPFFHFPDLHALRARVRALMERVDPRLQDGASFAIDELSIGVARGTESLVIGPGKMTLARSGNAVTMDFAPGTGAAGSTPLSLHASAPIGDGDVVASLAGGPIALDLLGVKEGALGIEGTKRATVGGKATVTLDAAGKDLVFDVDLATKDFAIKHAKIAADAIRGLSVRTAVRGALDDGGHLRVDEGELTMGALHLRGKGTLEQTEDHLAANLSFELPTASCQSLLESVPPALLPHLAGARYKGTLAARGFTQFDTRKIDDLVLKYDFDDFCKMIAVPSELDKDRFRGRFTHPIVTKDDKPDERTTGPGEPSWTDVDEISPFMQVAVLTTEDGSFYRHHGFNHSAIRASLIANVKAGKFVRGASTITMQLAKNLFLSRQKTLSRKLEELVLADYLEKTFKKEELMELYLNVIEFGPDVYGVRDAASHYFGLRPDQLNLAECLFLSSLLPNPRGYHKMYEKGAIYPYWITRIHQLMEVAQKNGKISPKELEEGQAETVTFHKEGEPPPPPRPSIAGAHFNGDDGNDWEALP
jgi:hypothetical protein